MDSVAYDCGGRPEPVVSREPRCRPAPRVPQLPRHSTKYLLSVSVSYYVAGVASKDDGCLQRSVRVADRIVEVEGLKLTGATRATLIQALGGKPGEKHKLVVDRGGKQFENECVVAVVPHQNVVHS